MIEEHEIYTKEHEEELKKKMTCGNFIYTVCEWIGFKTKQTEHIFRQYVKISFSLKLLKPGTSSKHPV